MRGIYPENSTLVPITGLGDIPDHQLILLLFVVSLRVTYFLQGILTTSLLSRFNIAFENIRLIAEAAGASLGDCVRVVVYTTDIYRYRPLVNLAQQQVWGPITYPPRTIVEVSRLNQDDIVEIETTFALPLKH